MSTLTPAKRTSRRVLYAIAGAITVVGAILLLSAAIVLGAMAAKSAGLTAEDFIGILSLVCLACGGATLGWMYAKSREA